MVEDAPFLLLLVRGRICWMMCRALVGGAEKLHLSKVWFAREQRAAFPSVFRHAADTYI